MKQKVHLSPVSVLKPACCLDSSIKRPFYETALTSTRKGRKYPKSGSINSFRQSEFANQTSQTSKANSNSCLRWFSVPLLPKPRIHRDEKTPHMYAYVVPVDPDSGRLNAKKWLGGAKALNEMQTDFAHQVGRIHGLQRGIEGSKAQHTTVREFYAAIQAEEHKHGNLTAEHLQPEVLEKKILRNVIESPEMVAERLTRIIKTHYAPAIKEAAVAKLERRRAEEMANTAKAKDQGLKAAQERLKGFDVVFDGLNPTDKGELIRIAAKLKRDRQVEDEKTRRIETLPDVLKRSAGTACVFAAKAMAAIKEKMGQWRKVDWDVVEKETVREAVNEHRQPMRKAVEAVLKHSPIHADKTPADVQTILDRIDVNEAANRKNGVGPSNPKPPKDRGYSR